MSLVVEDGTGLSNAEAYISVADADTYHTSFTGSTTWSGASEGEKEIALRQGAQNLDSTYRLRWKGSKVAYDQALCWPRYDVEDEDGVLLDSDEVPPAVVQANAEMGLRALEQSGILSPDIVGEAGNVKRLKQKLGPMEEETEYVSGASVANTGKVLFFQKVYGLVKHLLKPAGAIRRG